jgi:hypothetical protein
MLNFIYSKLPLNPNRLIDDEFNCPRISSSFVLFTPLDAEDEDHQFLWLAQAPLDVPALLQRAHNDNWVTYLNKACLSAASLKGGEDKQDHISPPYLYKPSSLFFPSLLRTTFIDRFSPFTWGRFFWSNYHTILSMSSTSSALLHFFILTSISA